MLNPDRQVRTDWQGNPIYQGDDIIANVGPEGDTVINTEHEMRTYLLKELGGVAVVADR